MLAAFNRAGLERPRTVHYVRRCGNKTPPIKRPPRRLRRIFRSLNLHGVYEHSQGKQKGGVVEAEQAGRSLIIPLWIAHVTR